MKFLYKKWWKILSGVLILFSIFMGLYLPVGPGIYSASPVSVKTGESVTLNITGYNTHFNEPNNELVFWLRKDSFYLCAESFQTSHNDHATAIFNIQGNLPEKYTNIVFDLVANNNIDGTFSMIKSVKVLKNDSAFTIQSIYQNTCKPEVTTNHPQYMSFPYRVVLYETIRNLFFHVPMWFSMTFILLISFIYSIKFLRTNDIRFDIMAVEAVNVGILFGLLGFATGSLWGNFAWGKLGDWLLSDTKILGALIGLLIYFAYIILRGSIENENKRARISAVFNVFAFVLFLVFIFVLPRMTETLHPGNGGNPAFSKYDLDNTMRWIFYPAVIGWVSMTLWLTSIRVRTRFIKNDLNE
jgi:heme exporter protein C